MGEAIVRRLLGGRLCAPSRVLMSDLSKDRLEFLKKEYHIRGTADNIEAAHKADILILAVKPQHAREALSALRAGVRKGQLVISIMAGVPIAMIQKKLGINSIVRSMPNTPAQIGCGVVVWHAAARVSKEQKQEARAIFAALGYEQEVENEDIIDKATAVSGSGPAYVFYFASCLIDAARALGFSETTARQLVAHTLAGSSQLLLQSKDAPSVLQQRVTSKGGTTEAAFKTIIPHHIEKIWKIACKNAYKRAKKLSAALD